VSVSIVRYTLAETPRLTEKAAIERNSLKDVEAIQFVHFSVKEYVILE
jgi:hypothetical protein